LLPAPEESAPDMKKLQVKASLESMGIVQDLVIHDIETSAPPADLIQDIKLVLEEIFTNIVFYAYPGSEGTVHISCFRSSDRTYCIEFKDSGIPFDPLRFQVSDLDQDFSERAVGGLGIHLVRQLAHEVHYKREGQSNVLTVCFRIK
jgi:anti-sigma regulatory factor (Ser/Thr protein kinase)